MFIKEKDAVFSNSRRNDFALLRYFFKLCLTKKALPISVLFAAYFVPLP
jgi:hypothetical protein